MSDRTAIRAGMAGAVLAAICCAAPLLAVGLPFAGLGAWLAGKGLIVLPLMIASFGLIAWIFHRRRAKAVRCETTIHKEGVTP
jgi:mercuric ion transport protein